MSAKSVLHHSPTLTKLFDYEHVILLEKTNDGCKVCYGDVVNTISKLTDGEWKYIEQVMLFENSRPLILVEGPGDVKYIRKAIEILSEDKSEFKNLRKPTYYIVEVLQIFNGLSMKFVHLYLKTRKLLHCLIMMMQAEQN